MSKKNETDRALAKIEQEGHGEPPGRTSFVGVLRRLPNAVLIPGVMVVFGALLADLAIADPLPVLDEGLLLWTLAQGLRVLGERRKAARAARAALASERSVVAEVLPEEVQPAALPTR
jgi:hypothetical protein